MVKANKMRRRFAFTMIELIFAIVIIAISVMSLPMITQATSNSIDKNLVQEAMFAAVAEINIATAYTWDENSSADNASDELTRVINNSSNECKDTGIVELGDTIKRRDGHMKRRCLNDLNISFSTMLPANCEESVDSNEHNWVVNVEGSVANASATGYKREYASKLDVERCDSGNCIDFGDVNSTNIKEITVTVRTTDNNETVTILRTYTANIGEVAYVKRDL